MYPRTRFAEAEKGLQLEEENGGGASTGVPTWNSLEDAAAAWWWCCARRTASVNFVKAYHGKEKGSCLPANNTTLGLLEFGLNLMVWYGCIYS
jgi:hypothetical protein